MHNIHHKLKWETIVSRLNKHYGYKRFGFDHKVAGGSLLEFDRNGEYVRWVANAFSEDDGLEEALKKMFEERCHNYLSGHTKEI